MQEIINMGFKEKLAGAYYTAAEARSVLGLRQDEFHNWVRADKIRKVMLPGRKQGVYSKREVDMLAAKIESAVLAVLREDGLRFRKATLEEQEKEFRLAVLNFGEGTTRFHDKRRELLEKNPDMSYYLYDNDSMVGSINVVPIDHEGIAQFKQGERGWLLGDHVVQYEPGKPLELIIIDLITSPLVPSNMRTQYALHLFFGMANVLENWGKQGVQIANIYACGGTSQGRRLLETAGFTYLGEPKPGRHMYELDVMASKLHILEPYKNALADWYRQSA